jgi:hypothetical protein
MKHTDRFLLALLFMGLLSLPRVNSAQELHAHVTVIADKIRGVDPSVFENLQKAIQDFLNTRQWSDRSYTPQERIDCNFLLDLQAQPGQDMYLGLLTVQSMRPVYNSTYNSNLLNFKDKDVAFKYSPFQQLVYNDTRISGNDPMESNLTAILAYYAYIIIGLDQDSFAPDGGDALFKKAQNVVNNAPANSRYISGWKAFEGTRNRYWLTENLLNNRYKNFHEVLYRYHRQGLDLMYDHIDKGRETIVSCLNLLNAMYADNPNTMILQLFFEAKSDELEGIFSKAPTQQKVEALNLLQKLDPQHGVKYREDLKQ